MNTATTGTVFCQFCLNIPDELTIPGAILVEELRFQWQKTARYIRLEAEPKRIVASAKSRKAIKNVPDDMNLIINFLGFRSLLNESHDSLELLLTSSLESRRIMEDETRVAFESERTINIVDSPLQC